MCAVNMELYPLYFIWGKYLGALPGGSPVEISVAQLLIGYPILSYFYPIICKLSYILFFVCLFY